MKINKPTKESIKGLMVAFSLTTLTFSLVMSCQPKWTKTRFDDHTLPPPEIVNVCIDVDSQFNQKIFAAVTAWDNSIGVWKHLVPAVGLNKDCNIKIIEVPGEQEDDLRVVGRAFMSNDKIHLYKGRHEKDTTGIVLHEIGHLLGAKHMEGTLMDPIITYKKYVCPDAATLAQIAIIHDVDPLLFKLCGNNSF